MWACCTTDSASLERKIYHVVQWLFFLPPVNIVCYFAIQCSLAGIGERMLTSTALVNPLNTPFQNPELGIFGYAKAALIASSCTGLWAYGGAYRDMFPRDPIDITGRRSRRNTLVCLGMCGLPMHLLLNSIQTNLYLLIF